MEDQDKMCDAIIRDLLPSWRMSESLHIVSHDETQLANCQVADQVELDEYIVMVPCPFCLSIKCDGFTRHTFLEPERNPEKETAFISLPLPSELITKIFSYLTPQELSRSVMPVCRQWRELAYEPNLWLSLSIDHTKSVTSPYLSFLLRRASKIKDLDLSRRRMSNVDVRVWSRHCKSLKSLNLSYCTFAPGDMVKVFETLAVNSPNIQKLNVKGVREMNPVGVDAITNFSKVRDINLDGCEQLRDESIKFLSDKMSDLEKINILGIRGITDDAIVDLVTKHKKTLRELLLHGRNLTDKSMRAIGMCAHLTNLAVSRCGDMTADILPVIKEMGTLRKLKLGNTFRFSSSDFTQLFTNSQLNNLTDIDFSGCINLDDGNIRVIWENVSKLEKVVMDGSSIHDVAIVGLATKYKESLKELVLSGENLTVKSVRAIEMCTNLTNLSLWRCLAMTDESLSVIKEMGKLTTLSLRCGRNFSSRALTQLFTNSRLNNLTELELILWRVLEDDVVAAILACCGCKLNVLSLTSLCYVNLIGITLEGIIATCREMREMTLGGHHLSGECLRRIPECMPHLVHLDLRGCDNINNHILVQITQTMNSLTIIDIHGQIVNLP